MLFNSFGYLIFLPLVVLLFWLSPQKLRTPLLLIASYVFYMTWKPIYGLLIGGLTLLNFCLGYALDKTTTKKKAVLVTGITLNLLLLAYFKYAYFTRDLANDLLKPLGTTVPAIPFQIILPLGISFFVFEFIHYLTDVYKGGKPVKSVIDFALFASFFPTQIAGPIKRYQDFIPQLNFAQKFDLKHFDEGINLILFGLFKKVLFADNLSVVVQSTFSNTQHLSSLDTWLSVYAFAFQIYFDFSGYTDIARGSAMLLGFKVPANFNLPYISSSIAEFWHRWHISLSTWLRDYLYVPLGGSRCSRILNYRNLFLTMLLGGLWHGAAMHFVAWGAYQGILLVLHKEYLRLTQNLTWFNSFKDSKVFKYLAIVLTFHFVCIGWVFFRAETMDQAWQIIQKLLFLSAQPATMSSWSLSLPSITNPIIFLLLPFIVGLLFAGQILSAKLATRKEPLHFPLIVRAAYVAFIVNLLFLFTPDASPQFIYFQF